ncbi:MAG: hypothetical protein JXR53_11500 [Bacteroidales bacterium]|nr:hypothetical protein [Bacteroidales bacterium]
MKVFVKIQIIALVFLGLMQGSCIEKQTYPDEPIIEYKNFLITTNAQGFDQTGYFIISFTDGDGDIGLDQGDTNPPYNPGSEYYYNFFITIYEKNNGIFQELSAPYNARIPNVNPEGIDKDLKGDIQIEMDLSLFAIVLTNDTIKMDAYIVDRALNASNTITTPEFVLNLQ